MVVPPQTSNLTAARIHCGDVKEVLARLTTSTLDFVIVNLSLWHGANIETVLDRHALGGVTAHGFKNLIRHLRLLPDLLGSFVAFHLEPI